MTPRLSVNLNVVALLRNRRNLPWPDLLHFGRIALRAGACGLTVHPRPDERHVRFSDLEPLRGLVRDEFPHAEFNIEGYPSRMFLDACLHLNPTQVTLVPDDPSQETSDHGWDLRAKAKLLTPAIRLLSTQNIRVSLFVDAESEDETALRAADMGAHRLELFTGPYASCHDHPAEAVRYLRALQEAGRTAVKAGLKINAGHDLNRKNLPPLLRRLPFLSEVSIGHALMADALEFGLGETVRLYNRVLEAADQT